ncbi:hypothetical protein ACN4EK_05670 [Pantanalinema rosaneae CENA516]
MVSARQRSPVGKLQPDCHLCLINCNLSGSAAIAGDDSSDRNFLKE